MRRKGKKKSEVECDFYLYFPRRLREASRQDGRFHGLLMPDAYAPRTRESALSRIEKDRRELDGISGWDMGFGYNYKVIKHFLKDPESRPQMDFEELAEAVIKYREEQDEGAFLRSSLEFFEKYPLFEGFWGRIPRIERRIKVIPQCLYCWNCFTTTPLDPDASQPVESCCEDPDLEPIFSLTFENMGTHELTIRRMGGYADFIRKRLITQIQGKVCLKNLSTAHHRRLGYRTKEATRRERAPFEQELERIRNLARGYRQEIRRARKDPKYRSRFTQWLKKKGLNVVFGTQELIEKWAEEELANLRTRYRGKKIPKARTVIRGPRKKAG
jgi:hypothetical protein